MIEIRPQPNGYDDRHYLSLKGTGTGDGQTLKVSLGETIIAGRSRWCEWSLKRLPSFLTAADGAREELRKSIAWRSTSRRHVKFTYVSPDMVEVENLSPNGTYLDGHKIDRVMLTDCRTKPHAIRLGPHGVTLELVPGALPI